MGKQHRILCCFPIFPIRFAAAFYLFPNQYTLPLILPQFQAIDGIEILSTIVLLQNKKRGFFFHIEKKNPLSVTRQTRDGNQNIMNRPLLPCEKILIFNRCTGKIKVNSKKLFNYSLLCRQNLYFVYKIKRSLSNIFVCSYPVDTR